MNKVKILEMLNKAALFAAGGVGYHVIDRALYYNENKLEEGIQTDRAEKLQTGIEEIKGGLSGIHEELEGLNVNFKSMREGAGGIYKENIGLIREKWFESAQAIKEKCGKVESKLSELSIPDWSNSEEHKRIEQIRGIVDNFTEYMENLEKTNKFLSNFSELYKYLDSISLLQESSLFHILLFIILSITVFNILSVLFANEIIKFFKLEEKYPSFELFFKLRMKFQRYYLMWNVLILLFVCIVGISIDILLFTVG
uniref:LAGLIDADG endonuclease n=1 Tax=Ganoderma calidophilum TaxID=2026244 RepID=A0A2S1WBQ7_9APHY|nr:hypothetical protein [Ganoderma calidophilum]AWJ64023.1 hypothetical protein [Ganoderma calidophilum]